MWPTNPFDEDPIDRSSPNKHSALSGDDNLGDLPGENPFLDQELKLIILSELKNSEISCSRLHVYVKDGFVSLTGRVGSEQVRQSIIAIIENVDGVLDVTDRIQIDDQIIDVPSPS